MRMKEVGREWVLLMRERRGEEEGKREREYESGGSGRERVREKLKGGGGPTSSLAPTSNTHPLLRRRMSLNAQEPKRAGRLRRYFTARQTGQRDSQIDRPDRRQQQRAEVGSTLLCRC